MEECPETSVLALSVTRQCKVHVTSISERSKGGCGEEAAEGGSSEAFFFVSIALMDGRAQTLLCFSCFGSNLPANRSLTKVGAPQYRTRSFFCFSSQRALILAREASSFQSFEHSTKAILFT